MIISRDNRIYPKRTIERIIHNHMRLTLDDMELYTNAERCLCMAFDTAESYTNRIIVPCDVKFGFDNLTRVIEFSIVPISEIVEIIYYDSNDELKRLAADSYTLTAAEHRSLIEFYTLPTLSARRSVNRVQFVCSAGYRDYQSSDDDVGSNITRPALPGFIEAAVQLLAGTLAEAEGDVIIGRQVNALPITAQRLLDPYRIMPYGGEM